MSEQAVWGVVALTALTAMLTKGVGPGATGSRDLPPVAVRVVVLLAPALLSALVVMNALADDDRISIGADTVGALVACLLLWRRAPVLVVVVAAAAATAVLRALT